MKCLWRWGHYEVSFNDLIVRRPIRHILIVMTGNEWHAGLPHGRRIARCQKAVNLASAHSFAYAALNVLMPRSRKVRSKSVMTALKSEGVCARPKPEFPANALTICVK